MLVVYFSSFGSIQLLKLLLSLTTPSLILEILSFRESYGSKTYFSYFFASLLLKHLFHLFLQSTIPQDSSHLLYGHNLEFNCHLQADFPLHSWVSAHIPNCLLIISTWMFHQSLKIKRLKTILLYYPYKPALHTFSFLVNGTITYTQFPKPEI